MSNFKVGDRVYVDGYTIHNDRGEKVHVKGTGVISSTKFAPDVYSVKMDKPYINQHYCTTTFFSALPHELFTIKKEEELRMTNTFKVGTRVYVDGYTTPNGKNERVHVEGSGTVNHVGYGCTVTMDKPFVDEVGRTRSYFVAFPHEVRPLKNQDSKLVFYTKNRTVHCKLFSAESLVSHAQATCSPDDTFDFLTGVQIALQRMLKAQRKELVLPALKNIKFIDFN